MFQEGLEMFRFPVMKSSLRFPNVKIIAVPATSFINDLDNCDRLRRSLYGKKDFMRRVFLKNIFDINKRVETIYTRF